MELDRRIRVLDAAMGPARARISQARSRADVQRLRERRAGTTAVPVVGPLLRRGSEAIVGRPRREVTSEDRTLPGSTGDITFRLYRPPTVRAAAPLVVHLHGGGWVLGDLDGADWLCSTVAADADVLVASVDYRLAPEHPAPAAVEDACAALTWLAAHGSGLGAGGPLAVMGDSAGGNLAALAAIAARDAGGPPLAAQVLVYPATDLTLSFPSHRTLADAPLMSAADVAAFRAFYLGEGGDPADPRLSPWFVDDLSGLAPALVQTAEHDPLRDEGRAYAGRLEAAGVPTRWTEYAGMPHGYLSLPGWCRSGPQAVAEIAQFLHRHLHGQPAAEPGRVAGERSPTAERRTR